MKGNNDEILKKIASQNIILEDRKKLSVSGVEDVQSFDEKKIIALTVLGKLSIIGEDLKIKKLNLEKSELIVLGEIGSLSYSNGSWKKGSTLISRLFR